MTGTFVNGSTIISGVTSSDITVGQTVSASGYTQTGAVVAFILSGSQVAMNLVALGSGTGITLAFGSAPLDGQGSANFTVLASGNLTYSQQAYTPRMMGIASFSFAASGMMIGNADLQGIAEGNLFGQGFLSNTTQGLTVRDVVKDILLLWGIERPELAFPWILQRAIHDLNGAMQMIWSTAKDADFFSRQTLSVPFSSGVSSVGLPQNVLGALGPARLTTGQPLRVISTRGQYDTFGTTYLGSLTFAVASGTPMAFFLERLNQATPDNVKVNLHVVPAPSADTTILLDVSVEAPRYQFSDFQEATPVEMFHLYADSVLLPFARYKAMSAQYFIMPERIPAIVADYQAAMRIIGAVDPELKEVDFSQRGSASVKEAA